MDCPERDRLINAAKEQLARLSKLSDLQYGAVITTADFIESFDKELENVLGEKERLLGALKQHRKDHGC